MTHPPAAHHAGRRLLAAAGAATLAGTTLLALGAAPAMAAGPVCGTFERADVSDGALVVQNNAWGETARQCVAPRDGGFTITTAQGDLDFGGAPKSYPSIFAGEHYGQGSETSSLPVKVNEIGDARSSARITKAPGAWNAAWDIWVNTSPDSPEENDDTEIMVWADTQGGPTPIGRKVDTITVEGRTYQVWKGTGPGGTDALSYVDIKTTTNPDIPLAPFLADAISRGATDEDSWVTSVQFGFEPWKGGKGLAVDDFTYDPTAPAERPSRTTAPPASEQQAGQQDSESTQTDDDSDQESAGEALVFQRGPGNTALDPDTGLCLTLEDQSDTEAAALSLQPCQDQPATAGQTWTTS